MLIETDDLLTFDMAVYELGLTRRALHYRIEKDGAPPGIVICGKQYFFRSTIKNFVKSSRGRKPRVSN